MINGSTQIVGLIGHPVEHSLSPAMHNAAFDALGLNWRYLPLPVRPGKMEAGVRGLAALGLRGANVTVPHKRAALATVDVIAPSARVLGAVNTIVVDRQENGDAVIHGHNTDHEGFTGALLHGGFDPLGKCVVVVGAGGAGRAAVYGLLKAGAQEILVYDIAASQAEALVSDLSDASASSTALRALPSSSTALVDAVGGADLLVNATPMGMHPKTETSIWPIGACIPAQLTVFDLVYSPPCTRLLKQAEASGVRAIGGLEMLVRQGALAFELWTGKPAPADIMRAACGQALERRSQCGS